jgi:hypothetical protein
MKGRKIVQRVTEINYKQTAEQDSRRKTRRSANADVDALVKALVDRWPRHKKDNAQLLIYYDDIADLVEECGFQRVFSAAKAAHQQKNWLPEAPELRELLPAVQMRQWRDPNCRDCRGSSWRAVEVPSTQKHLDLYGEPTMLVAQRCFCQPPAEQAGKKPEAVKKPIPFARAEFA